MLLEKAFDLVHLAWIDAFFANFINCNPFIVATPGYTRESQRRKRAARRK